MKLPKIKFPRAHKVRKVGTRAMQQRLKDLKRLGHEPSVTGNALARCLTCQREFWLDTGGMDYVRCKGVSDVR